MELQTITDVSSEAAPPPSVSEETISAPADESGSEPLAAEPQAETAVEQPTEEAEAPFKVPENDDDLKGQENNPHVQAVIQLRQQLRERDQRLDGYKPLETWKPVADTIGDPLQAKTAYELVQALRTPVEGQPNEFTTKPFIERVDQEFGQGSANQIFHDLLTYEVPDENGRVDTLVRHMYRSHGLDPDRINDYRNIDTLRASGVVTTEDLSAIPEKYHDAFRALSQAQREDIIAQKITDAMGKVSYPAATLDYLQDKAEALEARQWRERDEQAKRDAAERQQAEFQQQVVSQIEQDIGTEVQSMYDSIHQNLSSQITFSSDPAINAAECDKILGVVANLQSPYPVYRNMAIKTLKAVGVDVNGFEELANRWEQERSKYVAFKASGQENTWDGREALSKATFAKQQILARANDYVLKLAKAGGERAATAAAQTGSQLAAATARFVPSGAGQIPQGATNPYAQNPHPVGSQEYYAFNRRIDKEYGLTNASAYGS